MAEKAPAPRTQFRDGVNRKGSSNPIAFRKFTTSSDEQKETPGMEKAPGVSSPQRKESGRSGRDDRELRFGVRPGHPCKAVTSISQAEALAHGLAHLHLLCGATVRAVELDGIAALQDAVEDAFPSLIAGRVVDSPRVEVRGDDHGLA